MRCNQLVKLIVGIVGLSILIWANGVMAQPPLQILRIPASGFTPENPSLSFVKYAFVLSKSTGSGSFYFPITLSNGSVIKQIELNCYENDPAGHLTLRLKSANNSSQTTLLSVQSSHFSGVQNVKSEEGSHQIDYANNNYSLELYFANHTTAINFFSAVVYYQPPTNLSYLPQITK